MNQAARFGLKPYCRRGSVPAANTGSGSLLDFIHHPTLDSSPWLGNCGWNLRERGMRRLNGLWFSPTQRRDESILEGAALRQWQQAGQEKRSRP